MLQESKRVKSARNVSRIETRFACPICQSSMKVVNDKSIICSEGHTFDFAKQGYLNLTTRPVTTKYSKTLFEARRKLMNDGAFFDPLIGEIIKIINEHVDQTTEPITILDMGCGEGSYLSTICQTLSEQYNRKTVGVGVDLSKEGIMVASKHDNDLIWLVADLARTPFKNEQFNVILNILSPSNYAEFKRVLNDDGLVIKVVPQSGYLKELRECLFDNPEQQHYSNTGAVKLFYENYKSVEHSRMSYTVTLDKTGIGSLVQMTPLTWTVAEERLESFLKLDTVKITVDMDILVGKHSM